MREEKFVMHISSSSLRLREMERISVDVAVDYAEAFQLERSWSMETRIHDVPGKYENGAMLMLLTRLVGCRVLGQTKVDGWCLIW